MDPKGNFEKPIKPKFEEFDLDDEKVRLLSDFKYECKKKSNKYIFSIFILLSITGIVVILTTVFNFEVTIELFILVLVACAFISWGIFPIFFMFITHKSIYEFLYEKTKNKTISTIEKNHNSYSSAMEMYKNKNYLFERAIMRTSWQYWFSLSFKDFEVAVGELFLDKGYEVRTTTASRDHGVDLYLEKEGKKYVVQCKTYKKTLGPNIARDLYGTMTAEEADGAFLVAPSGFSDSTMEFCKGKPITLLDIDGLTKMIYDFERYVPYWIDNLKSTKEIINRINRDLPPGKKIFRKY